MFKKVFIVFTAFFLIHCGKEKANTVAGAAKGLAISEIKDEAKGKNCEFGGKKVLVGLDKDADKKLSDEEVSETKYVCKDKPTSGGSGSPEAKTLVSTKNLPKADKECPLGGQKIIVGKDKNKNGSIDKDEIENTTLACNPGGQLSTVSDEKAGSNCSLGGKKISSGSDKNGNDKLEDSEIKESKYVCNKDLSNKILVKKSYAGSGGNCGGGLIKVDVGPDKNQNNVLDKSEIQESLITCNARPLISNIQSTILSSGETHKFELKAEDRDGSIKSFFWKQTLGTTVNIVNETQLNSSFTAPTVTKVEELRFQLKVTDNFAAISYANVTIKVKPKAPNLPSKWQKIITGTAHTCLLGNDKMIWCFGEGSHGQLGDNLRTKRADFYPAGLGKDWKDLASSHYAVCAIKEDGTLWCWGTGSYGLLANGNTSSSYLPKQAGTDKDWVKVFGGGYSFCAIKTDGTLWCWGRNSYGQLGVGTPSSNKYQTKPKQVGSDKNWSKIEINNSHSCGIKTDGTLYCWGRNYYGQVGNNKSGTKEQENDPVKIGADNDWISVHIASNTSFAQKKDKSIYSWGYGGNGILGNGSGSHTKEPKVINTDKDWKTLSSNFQHACAIKDNASLWCWGKNYYGESGFKEKNTFNKPMQVGSDKNWALVSTSESHSCAVKTDNSIYCWGRDYSYRLGLKVNPTSVLSPKKLGNEKWLDVASGVEATCGIKSDRSIWCSGQYSRNGKPFSTKIFEQVGTEKNWQSIDHFYNGKTLNDKGEIFNFSSSKPAIIGKEKHWTKLVTGHYTYCALAGTKLYCWGTNSYGQVGNNSKKSASNPIEIDKNSQWQDVSIAYYHSCAIKIDGTLWCWGRNRYGELGNGESGDGKEKLIPTQVGTEKNWKNIELKGQTSCAIKKDQSLWCWGYGSHGQLGLNSTNHETSPKQVGTDKDWNYLSLGVSHSCAIKSNNTLWCWGSNSYGRMGFKSANPKAPGQINKDTDWTKVHLSDSHSCALKKDQSLWCWGRNTYGAILGNPWYYKPQKIQ